MQKISLKKLKNSKNSKKSPRTNVYNCASIPFLFSVGADPTQEFKQKSSFHRELLKITKKLGPVLEKNEFKSDEDVGVDAKLTTGLPYKRRSRSSSPSRDKLKCCENKFALFPCGVPVVAFEVKIRIEEDEELRAIKEDYLRLLESAQENKTTECEDFDDEEIEMQKIISSLGFAKYSKE